MEQTTLSKYVKAMRKQFNLTQVDLSEKSGVGLRFVRELEQGKQSLRLDKVNQVLNLFGAEVGAVAINNKTDIE
jgi:y4mF family transcriptional regulator